MNQHEASRKSWSTRTLTSAGIDEINSGSLQRIADATEKMAANYATLQDERDMYKRWYREGMEREEKLARRIAALKGVITRMKKPRADARAGD